VNGPEYEMIYSWLSGSVIGIILLGTMGSVLGVILIYFSRRLLPIIVRWFAERVLQAGLPHVLRFAFFLARVSMIHMIIARGLGTSDCKALYAGLYVLSGVSMELSMVMFCFFLSLTVLFMGMYALEHPFLSAFLVAMTLLWFIGMIVDLTGHMLLRRDSLIGKYERKLERRYRDGRLFGLDLRRATYMHLQKRKRVWQTKGKTKKRMSPHSVPHYGVA